MRVRYEEAIARARHPASKWPGRGSGNRLEPEAWPVIRPRFRLSAGDTVFTLGSCFARNIERHLELLGFEVPCAAYKVPLEEWSGGFGSGILNKYTVHSMRDELAWAAAAQGEGASEARLGEFLLPVGGEQCIDLMLAGFAPVTRARALERRRELAALYRHAFTAEVVVMTLGLIETWRDAERGAYIQQTPNATMARMAPQRWEFEIVSYEDALQAMRDAIELLTRTGRPDKKILVTTSPVPMARSFSGEDVLVANTYSKSVLRAVCGAVTREYANVDYAPSYESAMLSRTPEVWEDDLVHVTTAFVGKIVERTLAAYVSEAPGPAPLSLDERRTRIEAAKNTSLALQGARGSSPGVRFKERERILIIFPAGTEAHGVEFGPLDLRGCKTFMAQLVSDPGMPPADVALEIRSADADAPCFSVIQRLAGGKLAWRVPLSGLPAEATVTISVKLCEPHDAGSRPRVRVGNARFIAPPAP